MRNMTLVMALTAACFSAGLLVLYGQWIDGLIEPSGLLVGRDFVNMHHGGTLLWLGRIDALFDEPTYLELLREWAGPDYTPHNFSYPPLLYPVAQALALMPYGPALAVWTLAGIAAVAAAMRHAGMEVRWLLLVLMSPPAVLNLLAGQNGFFSAALMLAATVATLRGSSVGAGAAWAALAFKPHLGACVLPFLLGQRRAAVLAVGALVFSTLVLLTIALYGITPWQRFLSETSVQQRAVMETWIGPFLEIMPTSFASTRALTGNIHAAYVVQAGATALAALLLLRAWPGRQPEPRDAILWLALGSALVLPYIFIYDLILLHVALALWSRDPEALFGIRNRRAALLAWTVAWFLPVLTIATYANFGLHVMPLFLFWLLWRRGVAPRRRGVAAGLAAAD